LLVVLTLLLRPSPTSFRPLSVVGWLPVWALVLWAVLPLRLVSKAWLILFFLKNLLPSETSLIQLT
jgi:hypothetical protein